MAAYAIIGGGQAGAWLAKTLRKQDGDARIVVIADEQAAPYERPPLSKEVLKGEAPPTSTTLLSRDAAGELGIELWLGETARQIDRVGHRVHCASGRDIEYTKLFLATGSRVRTLPMPGVPADRVFYLRTLADAENLRAALDRSERVLIVGGGWIGLEVAAAARAAGKQVSVIERAPRLCARAVPPAISDYLSNLHTHHGVDIRTGTTATLTWDGSAVVATTDDGKPPLHADMAVVAVGIVPNIELAVACGLAVDNGVVVDEHGRTSDADILAAGDVTNHPCRHSGARVRLESWDNAQNQAIAVARAVFDPLAAYDEIPWFWSDQYDVNLQIIGLPPAGIEPVRRDDPAGGSCTWFFWRDGCVLSAIAVNGQRDIKVVKKWMKQGRFPDPQAVRDVTQPLQRLPLADRADQPPDDGIGDGQNPGSHSLRAGA